MVDTTLMMPLWILTMTLTVFGLGGSTTHGQCACSALAIGG
jgi:hypothetical protein